MSYKERYETKYNEAILKLLKENVSIVGLFYSFYKSNHFKATLYTFDKNMKPIEATEENTVDIKIGLNQKFFMNACFAHKANKNQKCFFISEKEKIYYCYGCGKVGNQFDFLMENFSISLDSATRILAKIMGSPLEELTEQEEEIYTMVGSYYHESENLVQESNIKTINLYQRIDNYLNYSLEEKGMIDIEKVANRLSCSKEYIFEAIYGKNEDLVKSNRAGEYVKRKEYSSTNNRTFLVNDDDDDLPF